MMFNASRRHVVIEGCDGTGKDTLIKQLIEDGHLDKFQIHERASTSLGGPHADLDAWVDHDLLHLVEDTTHRYVYNRHPLVSETIYSRWRHVNRGLSGRFRDRRWVRSGRTMMARMAVLVICQPPAGVVHRNLDKAQHMPGVRANWTHIYNEYRDFVWPGTVIRYDYTTSTPADLMSTLNRFLD